MNVNSSTSLLLARTTDTFSGLTQTVAITSASQIQIFTSTGIQIGNKVDILGSFNVYTLGTYTVSLVTPTYVEVTSLVTLPAQSGVTVASTDMVFYSSIKRWVRVEVDRKCAVKFNADTTINNRLDPITVNGVNVAYQEKMGCVYSLVVTNRELSPLTVKVWSVE
jgi:hypothetical protein